MNLGHRGVIAPLNVVVSLLPSEEPNLKRQARSATFLLDQARPVYQDCMAITQQLSTQM